mmetsp:Transcript_112790/g.329569  ORF Transcript_112790/g.329569 Transcript_112790/m.329569 type:complete len:96 (-) Transcript_112790:277-564(-)
MNTHGGRVASLAYHLKNRSPALGCGSWVIAVPLSLLLGERNRQGQRHIGELSTSKVEGKHAARAAGIKRLWRPTAMQEAIIMVTVDKFPLLFMSG